MYPIKLKPACKDYIWGGTRLKERYGKVTELPVVAESWELSCHEDGQSIAANGEHKGLPLLQIIEQWGADCLGKNGASFDRFPILIKLIDSKQPLSVQVHPGDAYALEKAGEYGKTELWYVIEADEDASLVYGFKQDVTKDELRNRIQNNTLTDVLNIIPVQKGDAFHIPSGLVHAIGKGILIAEIQQNSNVTYRLFDYGRKGADGKQRPLHIEDGLRVATLTKSGPIVAPKTVDHGEYQVQLLSKCEYFTVEKYEILSNVTLRTDDDSFASITMIEGSGYLEHCNHKYVFHKGETYFIPANLGNYTVHGKCVFLLTKV